MADIRYLISVDSRNAQTNIERFDGSLKGLGNTSERNVKPKLGGLWKQMAGGILVAQGITKAISGAGGLIKSIFNVGIETENYKVRLEALLGSQEAATEAMQYFKEVAAGVPFTLQEVIESGTQLTAFGLDMKEWTPVLTDLAAVMGMDLPEAASALGRAYAGGAGAADIFRERGILQIIKDSAKMKDGIDDITKLTLPEFRDVMYETFTDPKGKITGAADKLAKTWSGTVSMLEDKWFQTREKIAQSGIFDMVKEKLVAFNDKLQEWIDSGQMEKFAKNVSDGLETILGGIEKITRGIQDFVAILKWKAPPSYLEGVQKGLEKARQKLIDMGASTDDVDLQIAELDIRLHGFDRKLKEVEKSSGGLSRGQNTLGDAIRETAQIIETSLPKLSYARSQLINYSETITETAIPAARDLGNMWGEKTEEMAASTESMTERTSGYFSGLYNDIATGLGRVIEDWLSGGLTMVDFMKGIFDEIKKAFFRMVGEMTADAILGKFQSLFKTIGKEGGDTLGKLSQTAGNLAGGLLSSLGSIGSIISGITGAISLLKGPQKQTDVTFWLKLIYEDLGSHIMEKFDGVKASLDLTRDAVLIPKLDTLTGTIATGVNRMLNHLAQIKKNTAPLLTAQFGQTGLDTMVTKPTLFFAGERAPERVTITPRGGGGMGAWNFNATVNVYAQRLDDRSLDRAAEKMFAAIRRQAARVGRQI